MKIAVLISFARVSNGRWRCADQDARALALAQRLAPPSDIVVLHASAGVPDFEPYLGLGAGAVTHLSLAERSDDPAFALAEACAELAPQLVLAGVRAEAWPASGMTPYVVAARLGAPLVANVVELSAQAEGFSCLQALPGGRRRRLRSAGALVATVAAAAPAPLAFAYGKARDGRVISRQGASRRDAMREDVVEQEKRPITPRLAGAVLSGDARAKLDAIFGQRADSESIARPESAEAAAAMILKRLKQAGVLAEENKS